MTLRQATELASAANELAALLEAAAPRKGLRHQRHAQHIAPARRRLISLVRAYWARQEAAILAAVKPRIAGALAMHPREASTPGGKQFAANLLPTSLSPLRFPVTPSETSEYDSAITDAIAGAAATIAKELDLGTIEADDVASRYLRDNSLSKLTGELTGDTTKQLQDALAEAWDAGGSLDQTVAAIKDTFAEMSDTRAALVAQNEVASAYNAGRESIARSVGFNEKSSEVESGNPCPLCIDNEAQEWIPIDEDFSSGDSGPLFHVNCECVANYRKVSGA